MKPTKKQLIETKIRSMVKEVLNEDDFNYYKSELNKINVNSEYAPKIQIVGGEGEKTKFITLNSESIPFIMKWLKTIKTV